MLLENVVMLGMFNKLQQKPALDLATCFTSRLSARHYIASTHLQNYRHRYFTSRGASYSSSRRWLRRQLKDPYVQAARKEGLPSRAKYKLEQIDKKYSIFHETQVVLELGAAPGSWSIYIVEKIGKGGLLVTVDLLDLDRRTKSKIQCNYPTSFIPIEGDFRTDQIKQKVIQHLNVSVNAQRIDSYTSANVVDVILSDMAPNFTGDQRTDALRTMALCEDALLFAIGSAFDMSPKYHENDNAGLLKLGGTFLCKYFTCGNENEKKLLDALKCNFRKVDIVKPPSSRRESSEKYVIATHFVGKR
jgi:23S rRNA (uridine2552-2'-O)-methyltransferase